MSILDRIRKLFGGEEIPEEAERIYRLSKTEDEALRRLEEERSRTDRHRETLIGDIRAVSTEEERLLAEGREESSTVRRRILAKQVAEIRARIDDLMNRVDLLTRRISIFDRQVALVRDRAVLEAPLPDPAEIEEAAGDALAAREGFEAVAELSELHRDVSRIRDRSSRERDAMRDLAGETEEEPSFDEMLREEEGRLRSREDEGGREALRE